VPDKKSLVSHLTLTPPNFYLLAACFFPFFTNRGSVRGQNYQYFTHHLIFLCSKQKRLHGKHITFHNTYHRIVLYARLLLPRCGFIKIKKGQGENKLFNIQICLAARLPKMV
jgi:hypothetical protein